MYQMPDGSDANHDAPPYWQQQPGSGAGDDEEQSPGGSPKMRPSATQRDLNESMHHMSFQYQPSNHSNHSDEHSATPYPANYTWTSPQQHDHGDEHSERTSQHEDPELLEKLRSHEERLASLQGKVDEGFRPRGDSGEGAMTVADLQKELEDTKSHLQQQTKQHRQRLKHMEGQHKGELDAHRGELDTLKQQANEQGWRLNQAEQQLKAQAQQIQSQSEQLYMQSQQQRAFDGALRNFQKQIEHQKAEMEELVSQKSSAQPAPPPQQQQGRDMPPQVSQQLHARLAKLEGHQRELQQPPSYSLHSRLTRLEQQAEQMQRQQNPRSPQDPAQQAQQGGPAGANLPNRVARLENMQRDMSGWVGAHDKDIKLLKRDYQGLEHDVQQTEDDLDSLESAVTGLKRENDKLMKRSKSAQNVPTLGMLDQAQLSPGWKPDAVWGRKPPKAEPVGGGYVPKSPGAGKFDFGSGGGGGGGLGGLGGAGRKPVVGGAPPVRKPALGRSQSQKQAGVGGQRPRKW